MSASREEMLACIDREIALRERVYPRWVAEIRMTEEKARSEIATMRDVRAVIAALPATQPGLFDKKEGRRRDS